jgi:hypothetical protein
MKVVIFFCLETLPVIRRFIRSYIGWTEWKCDWICDRDIVMKGQVILNKRILILLMSRYYPENFVEELARLTKASIRVTPGFETGTCPLQVEGFDIRIMCYFTLFCNSKLLIPPCLDSRLIDCSEVISLAHRPRSTPHKNVISASDTRFW